MYLKNTSLRIDLPLFSVSLHGLSIEIMDFSYRFIVEYSELI